MTAVLASSSRSIVEHATALRERRSASALVAVALAALALTALALTALAGCSARPAWQTPPYIPPNDGPVRPDDIVQLSDIAPTIVQDIRYAGAHNFLGRPVRGYVAPKCFLARSAAEALKAVQDELAAFGLGLTVYDCYRPQRAVDDFVAWAKDLSDTKMKAEFYPHVDKRNLFRDGYIAEKSGHSRGATMDLTITGLDMGTRFDYFDPVSHAASPVPASECRRNRLLLKAVMEKHGFRGLPEEWWHFTLVDEPYPRTYFNFEVR